jgi:hypothetical protein
MSIFFELQQVHILYTDSLKWKLFVCLSYLTLSLLVFVYSPILLLLIYFHNSLPAEHEVSVPLIPQIAILHGPEPVLSI